MIFNRTMAENEKKKQKKNGFTKTAIRSKMVPKMQILWSRQQVIKNKKMKITFRDLDCSVRFAIILKWRKYIAHNGFIQIFLCRLFRYTIYNTPKYWISLSKYI